MRCKKRNHSRLTWAAIPQFMGTVVREGKKLGIVVQAGSQGQWTVLALESRAETLPGVLQDHSLELVGTFSHLPSALEHAEEYASQWLRGESDQHVCPCIGGPNTNLEAKE